MAGGMGDVPAVVSAGVRWVGRVDISNSAEPRFSWSGSGFVATVNGDTISVKLRSDGDAQPIFFQPVIDNLLKPRVSVAVADGVKTVTLGTGLGATDHKVELYRETEGKPGFATSTFLGFASGTLKAPPNYSGRLIEIVGDSISAGYGSLGEEDHPPNNQPQTKKCGFTTETEGAFVTYGAVAARAAGADASILAGSGWGIYSDNQGNVQNVMPNLHARTLGASATPAWSFSAKPQVVVINLGTNDFSANMSLGSQPFSDAYNAFLTTVRGKYPDAVIFCAVGSMLYSTGLTNATSYIKAIVAARNTAGDMKVKFLDLGSQDSSKGTGCDWHPNATEQKRMADILSKELKAAVGW